MIFFKNNKGASLMEVVIGATLMTTVMVAGYKTLSKQMGSQKALEKRFEAQATGNLLSMYMLNREVCSALAAQVGNLATPGKIQSVTNKSGREIYRVGTNEGLVGLTLSDVTLVEVEKDGNSVTGEFKFDFTYKQSSKDIVISKRIPISLELNSGDTNIIEGCHNPEGGIVDTALKESCASLGGNWNDSSKRCSLPKQAPLESEVCRIIGVPMSGGRCVVANNTNNNNSNNDSANQSRTKTIEYQGMSGGKHFHTANFNPVSKKISYSYNHNAAWAGAVVKYSGTLSSDACVKKTKLLKSTTSDFSITLQLSFCADKDRTQYKAFHRLSKDGGATWENLQPHGTVNYP